MTNNEKFNQILNSCPNKDKVFAALRVLATLNDSKKKSEKKCA